MSKLELKQLGKRYGAVMVVAGLDLAVREGELVTLLGPSGCGKTTTLRMIAGFVDPSVGTIDVDGRTVSSPTRSLAPEHRSMAMIFQSYAIWPNMTVAQNVGFGLAVRKLARRDIDARVAAILDVVKLADLAGRYPAELSGGQQQRVALARAIVVRPAVLLLDEPLSNLDAHLREEMAGEIRRLHDLYNMTTVYVTHDQSEAMTISDRVAVMHGGRIAQIDTPWNIYNRPASAQVAAFIGQTNLVGGDVRGGRVLLDGLAVPLPRALPRSPRPGSSSAAPDPAPPGEGQRCALSIRPDALRLARPGLVPGAGDPAGGGGLASGLSSDLTPLGPVVIESRSYLGPHWNYVVRPLAGSTTLRVSAGPTDAFDVGAEIELFVASDRVAILHS